MFRFSFSLKTILFSIGALSLPVFIYLIWHISDTPATIATLSTSYAIPGTAVKQDLQIIPAQQMSEEDTQYTITDTTSDGIDIQFANATEPTLTEGDDLLGSSTSKSPLTLSFPKNYSEPITVKLDDTRTITITDLGGTSDYTADTLSQEQELRSLASKLDADQEQGFWKRLLSLRSFAPKPGEIPPSYLRYTSKDQRKSLLYAFQKDQTNGEKKLKHWTLYQTGDGLEKEEYRFQNAKLRINEEGEAEVFYYGEQDLKNDQAAAEVDTNLLERAQRFLAQEMGEDIQNGTSGKTPDFTIPAPYYLDNQGEKHEAQWKWNEESNTLSVSLTLDPSLYPLALDPTLSFTAPGVSNSGSVITGETANNYFGYSLGSGDYNADGKTDLAVSAYGYSTNTGRVYLFYNGSIVSENASGADIILTGETTGNYFGSSLGSGDWNADGKTDLSVGASNYSTNTGRVYLFYNGSIVSENASGADIILTGETTGNYFGSSLGSGDWNADGRIDLAASAYGYSFSTGRVYLFYNGSIVSENASGADIIVTGETTNNYFGYSLGSGDYNADGKTDLSVGASGYSSFTGRAYLFYNDGAYPATAATADVTLTGETTSNLFGASLGSGDYNADGKTDLAVGAWGFSSLTGRVYLFYNGSIITENASGADVIVTGETTSNQFGASLGSGDWNADGKTDLAVGASNYSTNTGRVYLFYNGSIVSENASGADIILTGETTNDYFGASLGSGDWNADGKTDLSVGAFGYSTNTGRVYLFYSQNGQVNTNQNITGNATSDEFGKAIVTGDFNADGRIDIAVGAPAYSTSTGRVYLFYNDGSIPTTAATADIILTGETTSDYFGVSLGSGDFNADGKTDLSVGAYGYSFSTGRVYLFYNGSIVSENASGADIIVTGETTNNYFGASLGSGDWNADGRIDLAASAYGYSFSTGRVYLFYNGSIITENASGADVIVTGETTSNNFGASLGSGDFNADGKTDLAVGAYRYSSYTGRVYLFYNGSIITENASGADVIVTGETTSNQFGSSLGSGDYNADGKTDLSVGASNYSTFTGRVYLFYNGSIITENASGADIIVTGETTFNYFGYSLGSGDYNADGKTDLSVGASGYSSFTGRAYLFYNDGAYPATAATADVTLTGETTSNLFGASLGSGDFNADGKTDLAVGAYRYSSYTGRVYIYETRENFAWEIQRQFVPTGGSGFRTGLSGSGQELQIIGQASSQFGTSLATGDYNADGKTDLAVGASSYATNTGRVYLFYGDGTLATGATSADVIITGETTNNYFGSSFTTGDLNSDGSTDLVVGAYGYSSNTGRAYIFYNDGTIPTTAAAADVILTGEVADNTFGYALGSGDFNADGRIDLVVGAPQYAAGYNKGRVYLFYSGNIITENGSSADVLITGTDHVLLGGSFVSGDFNADGKTDLVVGAPRGNTNSGLVRFFYNDGSYPATSSGADVGMGGETSNNYFGHALVAGDFNSDGRTDLATSSWGRDSSSGIIYIFYNDGTYPGGATSADVTINTGGSSGGHAGRSLAAGDFNADGRIDLAAGAPNRSTQRGEIYLFYNDGSYPSSVSSADVILTGEATSNSFGTSLQSGDWNADGRIDLAVGASGFSSNKGKVYLYTFNDPVITGGTTTNYFGTSLQSGDYNADGRTDLTVGAFSYSTGTGRAYIFYGDGQIPSTAGTADVTITGEATNNYFGTSLASGDFNADGKTDLAIGSWGYSSSTGRVYLFYNGSIVSENASGADIILTGETTSNFFGYSLGSGDYNADGKTDLAVGARSYSTYTGRVYLFYNGSIITENASGADVILTGETTYNYFGSSLQSGDWNADGKTDLAVGAWGYSSSRGRAYLFYNGSIITESASGADVIITAEATNNYFGSSLQSGDYNADGKTDLAVGADGYSTNTGRVYLFYNGSIVSENASGADIILTGEASSSFGYSLGSGDYNADGKTDLAVGAYQYSSSTGRVYLFYNGSIVSENASGADIILTGEASSSFGYSLGSGDYNADGRTDLSVGAYGYSSNTGRVYIFTTEAAAALRPPGTFYLKGTGKLKGTGQLK